MSYSWKFLEHSADFKIEITADSLEELFKGALKALADLLQPDKTQLSASVNLEIAVKSSSPETLLVDFLNEVLTFSDIHNSIFPQVDFKSFQDNFLQGVLKGKKVKEFNREIKGVTYHQLKINHQNQKWKAVLVLDT